MVGNDDDDDDDDDDDNDDDERTIVAVSCEKERRKRSEKSSQRCPSSIFATCGHNEWPDFFFRGRYSPSRRGIAFLSKPELQISDTEPLCRTGF